MTGAAPNSRCCEAEGPCSHSRGMVERDKEEGKEGSEQGMGAKQDTGQQVQRRKLC